MFEKEKYNELRAKAEAFLKEKGSISNETFSANMESLIEELNVQHIELELQNQELQLLNERILGERQKYIDMYMEAPVAYFTLNTIGNIIELNNAAAKMLGKPINDFYMTSLFNFIDNSSKKDFSRYFKELFSTSNIEFGEITFRNTQKELIHTKLTAVVYYDSYFKTNLCRCVAIDITNEKKAKNKLIESERKLNAIFDLLDVGVSISDEAGNIIDCNSASERILSVTKEEHITRSYSDEKWTIIRPDYSPMPKEEYASFIALNNNICVKDVIMGLKKPDGSIVWLRVNAAPIDIPGLGVVVTYIDITDIKNAEEALVESNERLTTVLNSLDSLIYISDMENYDILFVNEYAKNVFGEIKGQKCFKALQSYNEPCDFCSNNKLLDEDRNPSGVYIWEFQNKLNNKWYECHDRAIKWIDGKTVRMEIASDITFRKEAEEALKESEEKYRVMFDDSSDSYLIIQHNIVIDCNQASADLFRTQKENIIGKSPDMFSPLYQPSGRLSSEWANEIINNVYLNGKVQFEWVHKRFDGTNLWVEVYLSPMVLNGRKVLFSTVRDISKRKAAEELLLQNEQHLHELNNAKDKLFSIIAHDLKNPFNSLLGLLRYLTEDFESISKTDHKELISLLYDSSVRVYELLENLLEWSRSQRGLININPERTDIDYIVQNCVDMIGLSAKKKNIVINNQQAKGEFFANAVPHFLTTIIRNLITNSIKFTNSGGVVSIACNDANDYWLLSIKDTGIGMDESTLKGLFDLGNMTKSSGTSGETGTGLGLILCKEFIEKQGGEMFIKSEFGVGTTISFSVPKFYEI